MAQTPLALARRAAQVLGERGIEHGRLEAELLLASVLGIGRLDLYLQHERPLTPQEIEAYRQAVRRRLRREPLQYITGRAHFRDLVLDVDPRVLIPRPETEILVGEVLEWATSRERDGAAEPTVAGVPPRRSPPPAGRKLRALDIGTGSGAIALSLAAEGPFEAIVATDLSADSLTVARCNAERLGLADRIEFRRGELWRAVRPGERFDAIVSNPPYIAESERDGLAPEVREWEPAAALFAPAEGLAVLRALASGAPAHLAEGGLLALEIGDGQAAAVVAELEARGAYERPRVIHDLAGRERVVLAVAKILAYADGDDNNE